ncbi:FxLYD domain-containing protein [Halobacteria archaeon AArc-dxtr1]|nr:FxLYD domain-containing protein [Halobacteria archaeon AArc-dxtr1]
MTGQRTSTDAVRTRPTRRRVLASFGAGAAAVIAGCNGVGSDAAPSYETGTVGDIEGDDRTAEEMAAAEAVAEQEINEGVTPIDALSLSDHEFVHEDDYRGSTVQGTAENTGDDRIQVAEVRVRVSNDDGEHLGRYLDTTGDLEPDSTWAFEAILLESPADIDAYDVTALGTPT